MLKAVFIDDTEEYLECIEEYMEDFFRDRNITFKTFLMKNKHDDERIEKEIIKEKPQFIFSDMSMPYCDGETLIKRINKVYNPVTILISSVQDIHIHKNEFNYLLRKQTDLSVLKNAIGLIITSFEIEEELSIDQILVSQFPHLNYNERRFLRQIVIEFKDVDDPEKIKVADISRATNKEIHTIMARVRKLIKKIFKKKVESGNFVSELLKIVHKRGSHND